MDVSICSERFFETMRENPKGAVCECCFRPGKLHARTISVTQALMLARMFATYGQEWGDHMAVRKMFGVTKDAEESKLRYWSLLDHRIGAGGKWQFRVTNPGVLFLFNEIAVPKKAYVWESELVDLSEETKKIEDILPDWQEQLLNLGLAERN